MLIGYSLFPLFLLPLAVALHVSGDALGRRDALRSPAAAVAGGGILVPPSVSAATADTETIDLDAINALRARTAAAPSRRRRG